MKSHGGSSIFSGNLHAPWLLSQKETPRARAMGPIESRPNSILLGSHSNASPGVKSV